MVNGDIELIARGVLIGPHGILLCRAVGSDTTFLPGGHVEFGESAATTLVREMHEEIAARVDVTDFLGAVESLYQQDDVMHHEVNLVFGISSPTLVRRPRISSAEPKLEFEWHAVNLLVAARLLPKTLCTLIPQWTRGKHVPWLSDVRMTEPITAGPRLAAPLKAEPIRLVPAHGGSRSPENVDQPRQSRMPW